MARGLLRGRAHAHDAASLFQPAKAETLDLLGYCPAERTLRLAFGAAAAFGAGHGFMKP